LAGQRFAISYDGSGWVASAIGAGPDRSGVEVDAGQVLVWYGRYFRLEIPRERIRLVRPSSMRLWGTRGVHGGGGRWVVNGSAQGLVELVLEPPAEAEPRLGTLFTRARVGQLIVSLADPDGFIAALQ
jgi:hypothetical protein